MIKPREVLATHSCENIHKPVANLAESDEPPESEPVPVEPAVPSTLVELGESHFWPHARMAGDLGMTTQCLKTQGLKTYVVNLKRRPDRRARMERVLPAAWDVQFTSDWDGPMDGQAIDPDHLPGFGTYQWEIPSDNPWWSRPLKLGEIGCAISHWTCWQQAAADGAGPALILVDDAVLVGHCAERLQSRLARLSAADPHWDLLYLGRWALDDADRAVTEGIVRPGYSYCTFGYLLSASGLGKMLNCGFERAADQWCTSHSAGHRAGGGDHPTIVCGERSLLINKSWC